MNLCVKKQTQYIADIVADTNRREVVEVGVYSIAWEIAVRCSLLSVLLLYNSGHPDLTRPTISSTSGVENEGL